MGIYKDKEALEARIVELEERRGKEMSDLISNQATLELRLCQANEKNAQQGKLLRATIEYSKRMNEMLHKQMRSQLQADIGVEGNVRVCAACSGVLESGRRFEVYWSDWNIHKDA